MLFWTERTSLQHVTDTELIEAIEHEDISDGWIAQLEVGKRDYLHAMAFKRAGGTIGFYLERRGPGPDQWYEGVTPGRPKQKPDTVKGYTSGRSTRRQSLNWNTLQLIGIC